MRRKLRGFVISVIVLAAAAAAVLWQWRVRHPNAPMLRTATVRRGDMSASITATGTIEPEEVVDVGAQVSGQFLEFGKDKDGKPIDYGSVVESNMLLAKIDDRLYKADVDLDTAVVASDKAGEKQAEANVEQLKAKEVEAAADWKRAQTLTNSEALAATTYDSYKATYEIAKANVELGVAAVDSAKAATTQATATLAKAQETLDYCTIRSPVNGKIIDRRVTIGETVASSLNTPSLFLIAKDLTRMQVWASVNEADIGSIFPDQDVSFTVDAFPNRTFQGKVGKVRLNATMTQNVVTYTVEVDTENTNGTLLPYLTANVHFLTGERHEVLMVLNSALRWYPPKTLLAPVPAVAEAGPSTAAAAEPGAVSGSTSGVAPVGGAAKGPRGGRRRGGDGSGVQTTGTVWTPDGKYVRPITVNLGLTDGTWTEVQGEGLSENMTLVLGIETPEMAAANAPGVNPFIPQFPRRGGGSGGSRGGGGGGGNGGGGGRGAGGGGRQ